jgi:hypothetical protein
MLLPWEILNNITETITSNIHTLAGIRTQYLYIRMRSITGVLNLLVSVFRRLDPYQLRRLLMVKNMVKI